MNKTNKALAIIEHTRNTTVKKMLKSIRRTFVLRWIITK